MFFEVSFRFFLSFVLYDKYLILLARHAIIIIDFLFFFFFFIYILKMKNIVSRKVFFSESYNSLLDIKFIKSSYTLVRVDLSNNTKEMK